MAVNTTPIIISTPKTITPVSSNNAEFGSDFGVYSAAATFKDFRFKARLSVSGNYVTKVNFPPQPVNFNGRISMWNTIQSSFDQGQDLNWSITGITYSNQFLTYSIITGIGYNPELTPAALLDVAYGTSSIVDYFGFSFSSPHILHPFDVITVQSNNPYISGTAMINGFLFSTYSFSINKLFTTASNIASASIVNVESWATQSSDTYYAYNGTRQYEQNYNYDFTTNYVIGTGSVAVPFLTDFDSPKRIMIDQDETVSAFVKPNDFFKAIGDSFIKLYDNSNNLIQTYSYTFSFFTASTYYRIDIPVGTKNLKVGMGLSFSEVKYYTYQLKSAPTGVNSEILQFDIDRQCYPYGVTRFRFLNSFGSYDYFNFRALNERSYNMDRNYMTRELQWDYNIGDRGMISINNKITENHKVTSDYLTESESDSLISLIKSANAYVLVGDQYYPIIITDSEYTTKNLREAKQIEITMNYQMAYYINNQIN